MTIFLACAALMVAAALAFVLVPLLRNARTAQGADASARRLRALDEALAAGVVDAGEYATKRASLAQPVTSPTTARPSRASFAALLLVALLLPASALLLYRFVGTPQALDPANLAADVAAAHGDRGPEMEQAIAMLSARLKEHPDDVEGWALLGRAYQATHRIDQSLDALRHAHELAADNAAITVEYAQALALAAPGHRIEGESRKLLETALNADAQNQRALWLLGISDYQTAHYDAAIARWNTLLPLLAENSDVVRSVKKQIAEAEARRDGKALPEAASMPESASAPTDARPSVASADTRTDSNPATTAANTVRLTIRVALDSKLKDRLDPEATLFVFARAASGPPMPLAIQRLKAGQLPLTVTLDESMGMLPTMKLSMFPQVVVGARVSKSGNAMPQSGDLQRLSAPLDVHRTEPIELTIDQAIP
ncbi:c-type cytochrome biogenesis protein CcmI [Dokdonella soli]|uniref:C-type cytochrome biogenesis protein CcmI n=1 Tax=Dokdonella soli TaxID=529810 RepID=A0ABN1IJD3_9GAMM